MLDQASFVINVNPELRISPGFLSRVGKGLVVLRVEVSWPPRRRGHVAPESATRWSAFMYGEWRSSLCSSCMALLSERRSKTGEPTIRANSPSSFYAHGTRGYSLPMAL